MDTLVYDTAFITTYAYMLKIGNAKAGAKNGYVYSFKENALSKIYDITKVNMKAVLYKELGQGEYGRTSGITQIPRIRVNNDLHIYVVNGPTLGEDGLACGTQKVSKEHAIVSADITIDK